MFTKKKKEYLDNLFTERVSFNKIERKLYGHDIGELPSMIKPFIGKTLPDAIVQPVNKDEIKELVKWANNKKIPLTPRGKATSGYGGVLPIKKGIVVDFYRFKDIISIDKENNTVTVQSGIVWESLDKELKKHNLTLCSYPTSYLASTVGGWLAQGGAGIGSYEYGWFIKNVIKAKVIDVSGNEKIYKDEELELISETEGIMGFITEITLKVQPLEELGVFAATFQNPTDLKNFMESVTESDIPVWSFLFINPKMAEFKNIVPLKEHLGHADENRLVLPEKYIVTIAFRQKDENEVVGKLSGLVKDSSGIKLDNEFAQHEWERRFKIMQVKRLGPSLVPVEIVVPVSNFAEFTEKVSKLIKQPIVKEGILIKNSDRSEVVILGFIPGDQRTFKYHFAFSLFLSIMKIAEKLGGRLYSTGLYFTNKAKTVFGKERIKRIKKYKKLVDPKKIMNPGKVTERKLISRIISFAGFFEPFTRFIGNRIKLEFGERIKKAYKEIPADVAWHALSCSQCGNCIDTCDQFSGRGWESQSPRGKWYWLKEYMAGKEKWNQQMVDTFLACTTCEMCNERCSESLPIEQSWMKLRGKLINEKNKMTFPPFEMMAAALESQGNIWAGYRKNRLDWFPEDMREKHGPEIQSENIYFTGCTASYVEHDIAIATVKLLDSAGVEFCHSGNEENCCGTPMLVAGKWDLFVWNMKKNINLIKSKKAKTVISSCPACDMMWRHVYPAWAKKLGIEYNIEAKHYSEIIAEKIKDSSFKFPANGKQKTVVTWHDSCHMGRVSRVYDQPRELIKAIPGVEFREMASNKENAKCCGSVLTLLKEPDVAAVIGKDRLDEAVDIKAEKMLALCPCCEFQLRVSADKKGIPMEVVDLAHFTAEALGHKLPDPNPEVKKQWAVFEAMIALMTPEGFAKLMGTMWKELIDAMPLGMGHMMRFFGKIPLMLSLMKPLFPVLFPILLPIMMPKVMQTMLKRVEDVVPMPDYMKEQMPLMMPGIMDNLMPHMIKDIVPLITQPMINYLRGKVS